MRSDSVYPMLLSFLPSYNPIQSIVRSLRYHATVDMDHNLLFWRERKKKREGKEGKKGTTQLKHPDLSPLMTVQPSNLLFSCKGESGKTEKVKENEGLR